MRRRYWIPSALLVTVGGLGARGYYSHVDAFLPTETAGNDAASPALTDKQAKAHFDFKSAGIISDFKRCDWTRAQLNKAEPGTGDEHFKCEQLKSYAASYTHLTLPTRDDV